jgi:hypothetical protein
VGGVVERLLVAGLDVLAAGALRGERLQQLQRLDRVGQHQDGLGPAPVLGVGVSQGRECIGEERDRCIHPYHRGRSRAHVQGLLAVVVGAADLRELVLCRCALAFGGRVGVCLDDLRRHQALEP